MKNIPNRPLQVFVLEDDLELSTVIEKVLRSIHPDIHLDWVTSAESAINQLHSIAHTAAILPYDLIVADIFLDGKRTGLDFWQVCQEYFPSTPILITSALSLDRFFAAVGKHSISPPYLQKPFSLLECKNTLESMISFCKI